MANTPGLPQPAVITQPIHRRLSGALKPGTAIASGTDVSEVIALGANIRFLTIRAATATAGGTLKFDFVAPVATTDSGGYFLSNGEIDPSKVTKYADSLTPSTVPITAGTTPAVMQVTCNGESYGIVTISPGGTGTVSYVDLCTE